MCVKYLEQCLVHDVASLLFLKCSLVSGSLYLLFPLPGTLFSKIPPWLAPHLLVGLCLHATLSGRATLTDHNPLKIATLCHSLSLYPSLFFLHSPYQHLIYIYVFIFPLPNKTFNSKRTGTLCALFTVITPAHRTVSSI